MMKLGFVLVLVLAGAASGAIEKRIVGSTSCKKERQYHVQIKPVQGRMPCGGSLINTRWVITASHCAEQIVKVTLGLNNDGSFFSNVKALFKKDEQDIKPEQQFTFTEEGGPPHDIVLIKLNKDASPKLSTVKLPPVDSCKRPEEGQQVQVGGLGATKATEKKVKPPKSLMCASTKISTCGENDKPDSKYHNDKTITMCAFQAGVEACFGDSGTAVEYNGLLHGIVVSSPVDKCANPIVMLDICHYREWIEKTMRENP